MNSHSFFSDPLSLPSWIPLPVQRPSIFSVPLKDVPRQCSTFLLDRAPKSRKSTASVQGEGKRARRARVRAVAASTSPSAPCVKGGYVPKLLSRAVAGPISAYRHPVILLPHSWGILEGVQAGALTPAEVKHQRGAIFLPPEQSPISVILRVPRGESRRAEDRELGSLRANRAQNDKSWVVGSDRKIVRLFLLVSSSDAR